MAFAVMDDDGGVLKSRVLRVDNADVQNWDAVVSAFGYERLGRWHPAGGVFWCDVKERAGIDGRQPSAP